MQTISIKNIKPVGNFEFLLTKIRDKANECIARCNAEKVYNSQLAKLIKYIVAELGIIDVLEDKILKKEGWDIDEMMIDLIYTHIIIIDLNYTAYKYLNGITDEPDYMSELKTIMHGKSKIYKNVNLIP